MEIALERFQTRILSITLKAPHGQVICFSVLCAVYFRILDVGKLFRIIKRCITSRTLRVHVHQSLGEPSFSE
jgi:hypothetical protein